MPPKRGAARLLALLLAAVLLGLGVTACGGSGGSATAAGSSADQQDTARLKFRKCLQDNGVPIPSTPQQGGGGFRRALGQVGRTKLQQALKACAKYRTAAFGNITPQQRQEFQDAFVKFAACMRQHGVDVPTPNLGASGGGPGGGPGGGGLRRRLFDRNDPQVKAALQACRNNLPNRGRFGRGGGGPGGPPPPGSSQ